jgi:hypothetical protein
VTLLKFQVTLEIQDKNDGQDTDKIDVYVSFKITHQKTVVIKTEVLLKSIPSSAFTAGTKRITIYCSSCNYCWMKAKFITDQYTGGDQFVIRLAQVLKDGRIYTCNSNSNVVGGASHHTFIMLT